MSTMKKCLAVASYLLLLPLQSGATYFANNGTMTCTYPVTVTVNEMTCADTEYCSFGDEMSVYGSLTLEENLPSYEMCVTTKICFMGYSWLCKRNVNVTTNVCNSLGVSDSLDGTPCPNAGTFDFGSTVQVPGRPSVNLGSGWWVDVGIHVADCDQSNDYSFDCHTVFTTIDADSAYSSSAVVSGSALLGVAALALYAARKRRVATIDLAQEEQQLAGESTYSGFEMMSDSAVRV